MKGVKGWVNSTPFIDKIWCSLATSPSVLMKGEIRVGERFVKGVGKARVRYVNLSRLIQFFSQKCFDTSLYFNILSKTPFYTL